MKALAEEQPAISPAEKGIVDDASQLPVRYQNAGYMIEKSGFESAPGIASEEFSMPVGADISSTTGPISLRDILKRLAALKNMNISWSSDVDQYSLVDVDIRAEEDFFKSIDNILRQLDYFHEVKGNTIVVRYKETRKFHVAMPFSTSTYATSIGGDVLGASSGTSLAGNIQLQSSGNTFDIWTNIKENIDQILDIWETSPAVSTTPAPAAATTGQQTSTPAPTGRPGRSSSGKGYYSIDKPIGLITVTAPRPLVEKIGTYLDNLKSELYRQISIEAKIIEVTLDDRTKTGIDWSQLLDGLSFDFTASYGNVSVDKPLGNNRGLVLSSNSFSAIVSALETQGETTLLSNPKLSVMNGQPAMISIGESATYIDSVSSTVSEGVVTTSVTTSKVMSGLGMGVIATIMENDEIILSITPVTSDLQGDDIAYRSFGSNTVGLPVVAVKEMNTTVRIKDGNVLVIGGLIDKVDSKDNTAVPFLSKIPLIKKLFKSESKRKARSELIIVLRPKIIS
jgi:general secretion pathway protein D/MSHA biogenesis protein MshL